MEFEIRVALIQHATFVLKKTFGIGKDSLARFGCGWITFFWRWDCRGCPNEFELHFDAVEFSRLFLKNTYFDTCEILCCLDAGFSDDFGAELAQFSGVGFKALDEGDRDGLV